MNEQADDLYVALALLNSGLISNPEVAIEFSANLETKDFAQGVSIGSRNLREELMRAGRETFESLVKGIRDAICQGDRVRSFSRTSAELAIVVTELLVLTHGLAVVLATLCARIIVAEGLEHFCRNQT